MGVVQVSGLGWLKRVLLGVAPLALLLPGKGQRILFTWITDVAGIVPAGTVPTSEVWGRPSAAKKS